MPKTPPPPPRSDAPTISVAQETEDGEVAWAEGELGPEELPADAEPPTRPMRTITRSSSSTPPELHRFPSVDPVTMPRRRSLPPSRSFGEATGNALELVAVRAISSIPPSADASMDRVRDRIEVGDFSGALALVESIVQDDPDNTDARLLAVHCRDVLKQMYISRLGGLDRKAVAVMSAEQLRWLSLDHRSGFVLSLVDGRSTIDEVLDVSGMPDLDALRILFELLQQSAIRTQ